ncbi:UNVERIFIED_CONTAM: hypothetical protein K2H54_043416 [Gekko kuhli]
MPVFYQLSGREELPPPYSSAPSITTLASSASDSARSKAGHTDEAATTKIVEAVEIMREEVELLVAKKKQ